MIKAMTKSPNQHLLNFSIESVNKFEIIIPNKTEIIIPNNTETKAIKDTIFRTPPCIKPFQQSQQFVHQFLLLGRR